MPSAPVSNRQPQIVPIPSSRRHHAVSVKTCLPVAAAVWVPPRITIQRITAKWIALQRIVVPKQTVPKQTVPKQTVTKQTVTKQIGAPATERFRQ